MLSFPVYRLLPALLLAAVLSSCGFRLAGTSDLPDELSRIQLVTTDMSAGHREALIRRLRRAGAEVDTGSGKVIARLDVRLQAPPERRVATSASSGRTVNRVSRILDYSLHGADGSLLVSPKSLRLERDITLDDDNLLGTSEETAAVARELEYSLFDQLVRQLGRL